MSHLSYKPGDVCKRGMVSSLSQVVPLPSQEVPWQNTDSAGQLRVIHNTWSRLEDQLPTYLHLRPYVEGQPPNQPFTLLQLTQRLVV